MPAFALVPASTWQALPHVAVHPYEVPMSKGSDDPGAEDAGLRKLLGAMRSELTRFMLSRQCDPAEVEDLLQDLYVKLVSVRTGPVSNPRAYLYQMANNLLHDHRRGRRRQQERDDHWTRQRLGSDLERDTEPTPEEKAIARDELNRVNKMIASMPERTAQILKLYRLDGISQKAIASRMDLSLSAVEKHLQRAYRKLLHLRQAMDGEPQSSDRETDDV